jgi:hypothetical protein
LRPKVAQERLEPRPGGLVRITLKKAYAVGTVAVDMDPLSLLCRLATSVPPPRFHTVRYAGGRARGGQPAGVGERPERAAPRRVVLKASAGPLMSGPVSHYLCAETLRAPKQRVSPHHHAAVADPMRYRFAGPPLLGRRRRRSYSLVNSTGARKRAVCAAPELACRQIIVTNGDGVYWQGPDARPAAEVPWIRRLEEGEQQCGDRLSLLDGCV